MQALIWFSSDRNLKTLSFFLVVAAGLIVLLVPLCVTALPPIEDYPNHLARMWVLAKGLQDPFLSRMYAPDWHIIPDLAIDLTIPFLLHLLTLHTAGRVMLAMALLLPVAGTMAFHRALHGRRSFWPLAACLIAPSAIFLMGFVNFLVGVGIALLVAAMWTALRPARPALATAALALGAVVVFFCHLVPLVLLGTLVACTQPEDLFTWWQNGQPLLRRVFRDTAQCVVAFAAPLLLYAASPLGAERGPVEFASLKLKLTGLLSPVLNYSMALDVATGVIILAVVALFLSRRGREPVVPLRIILSICALFLIFAAVPWRLKGGAFFDVRFALMAAFLLFAGLAPPPLPRATGMAVGLTLALVFAVRVAVMAEVWSTHRGYVDALRSVVAHVPPGSRVLLAGVDPQLNSVWWHGVAPGRRLIGFGSANDNLPVLLLLERDAFSPLLFADPAQQPLRVRAAYRDLSKPVGRVPDYTLLHMTQPVGSDAEEFPYLRDWPHKFDFVLVIDSDGAPGLGTFMPDVLSQVAHSEIATLLRVCRPAPCGTS